jgi:hypothetical protein
MNHRPAQQRAQDFRQLGFHPGSHSGGQDHGNGIAHRRIHPHIPVRWIEDAHCPRLLADEQANIAAL